MFSSLKHKPFLKLGLLLAVAAFAGFMAAGAVSQAQEGSPVLDPDDPRSAIYLDTSGKLAGTGDATKPVSEAWKAGQAWHPQALQGEGLPKDRYGLVDWAKLVREGIINPRHSLDPKADEMPPLDMDVIIESKGDYVNNVRYPHEMHTYWLKCEVCHPKIFVPAKGQNNMTMVGITRGEWCGRCHGKVAFPLTDCTRCHTVPKKGAKK
ncbi:MAG: c(7)-type cytochrome triheme domain-containing protein [Thermodesulfobacteriota bacterium]